MGDYCVFCPQLIAYVESLTPNVTIYGDTAFKEVDKVKWGRKGWAVSQKD